METRRASAGATASGTPTRRAELAPRHYTDVRLHQGVLPGGVGAGDEPILRRTRYYDYRAAVPWRAEREGPA